jgi:hypothetical protein
MKGVMMDPNNRAKAKSDRGPLPDPDRLPDDMDEDDIGGEVTHTNACPEPEDASSIQRPPADS